MQPSDSDYQDIYSGRGTAEPGGTVHGESHILVEEGSVIFREGERGHSAFLLERGEVEISVQRNGQNVALARRGPGEVFGDRIQWRTSPGVIHLLDGHQSCRSCPNCVQGSQRSWDLSQL